MKTTPPVSQSRVHELFDYDHETGVLIRKNQVSGVKTFDGGASTSGGYKRVYIDVLRYHAHRIIWLWVTGKWPNEIIDHINRNRSDNRITNLREATFSQNLANRDARRISTLGIKGVSPTPGGKFRVQIKKNYITTNLGTFDTIEEASSVYKNAAREHFGEFAASSAIENTSARPWRFMGDGEGFENLAHDLMVRLMAKCVASQQAAGFCDLIDLRQLPCPDCGSAGFNTGWGYFLHVCGAESGNGQDGDCHGCTALTPLQPKTGATRLEIVAMSEATIVGVYSIEQLLRGEDVITERVTLIPASDICNERFSLQKTTPAPRQDEPLIDALVGVVRILEAVRYTTGLSGTQIKRLDAARSALAAARPPRATVPQAGEPT